MDFIQLQVNYLDWESPCCPGAPQHGGRAQVRQACCGDGTGTRRSFGRPAGTRRKRAEAADPDKSVVSWAYRFCYNLPNVISISGVSTLEQQENVREWKANEPFNASEEKALGDAVDALKSVGLIPLHQLPLLRERLPRWREDS